MTLTLPINQVCLGDCIDFMNELPEKSIDLTVDRDESYVTVARKRIGAVTPALLGDEGLLIGAPKPRVSFLSVIESGKLTVGDRLWLHKGKAIATIQPDGTIVADGHRGSIHKVGALCLRLPACNGWTHWYYRKASTGELRLIDELRPADEESGELAA